jgi:hypothetical protein
MGGTRNRNRETNSRSWEFVLSFLDATSIGINDSFLRLGGDSISVMHLIGAARDSGLILSRADVFRTPRLGDLAKEIRPAGGDDDDREAAPKTIPLALLQPGIDRVEALTLVASHCGLGSIDHVDNVMPCTPLQEGLLALTAKNPTDYVNQTVLELAPGANANRFRHAWTEIFRTTPILRTRIINLPNQGTRTSRVEAIE